MAYLKSEQEEEQVISSHSEATWQRREKELANWVMRYKSRVRPKQTVIFGGVHIDAELLGALSLFKRLGIQTEYSCAGVSVLDDPDDHSLYAYITFPASEYTESFIRFAMQKMKRRLLVTYEAARNRFDISSFYIQHNRSFCLMMRRCAEQFSEMKQQK